MRPAYRCIVLLVFWSGIAVSQPAVFPLHQGDRWFFVWAPGSGGGTFSTTAAGDTLMPNGKSYTRILYNDTQTQDLVRQSGDSVYYYNAGAGKEVLFFDFSRHVGDTVSTSVLGVDTMDIVLTGTHPHSLFGDSLRNWSFGVNPHRHGVDVQFSLLVVDSIGIAEKRPSFGDSYSLFGALIDGQIFGTILSAGSPGSSLPAEFQLWQNYPNPFNPATTIRYALPVRSHVLLSVSNALGQVVATLVDEQENAGYHTVSFDGSTLASGVYVCRLIAGTHRAAIKSLLIR